MEQRHARQQREAEEREQVEQERRELQVPEPENLLMPTCVTTRTEAKSIDSCQQTETLVTSVQTQTEATGNIKVVPCQRANAISAASLKENDAMTRFYTGLPKWALFGQIFSLISPFITPSRTRLTLQDELILVLVKLRLNPPFQDLAYRWGVSVSTITRMFHKWIDVMNDRMKFLIKWPSRDILRHNLPQAFKDTYPCIIDCSEIFIERPTSFEARAKTYSQYKKHNTILNF